MNKPTTITVAERGTLYAFRVVPLTSILEFIDNVGTLKQQSDVLKGAKLGWWKVVA
jgi:hypothetical protein